MPQYNVLDLKVSSFSCNYCTKKNLEKREQDVTPTYNQSVNGKVQKRVNKSMMDKLKDGLKHMWEHYKNGGKLLYYNVRQCTFILIKTKIRGEKMTRRERRLLVRTLSDLFRLIPLAAFVIIPAAEFALPFALALFPDMLPSTFADKEQKNKSKNKIMQEAEGLSGIMREALSRKAKSLNDPHLLDFVKKLKSGRDLITLEEIYLHSKIFEEEVTVDGLERKQAQAMCRLVGIQPFGPDTILRHRLKSKLNQIKQDDLEIVEEGVDSLDDEELEEACRTRGIYWKSANSVLKRRLKDWLKLSVDQNVPVSLLIFSRTLVFPNERLEQALAKSLSSIPQELVDDIEILNADLNELIKPEHTDPIANENTQSNENRTVESTGEKEEITKDVEEEKVIKSSNI